MMNIRSNDAWVRFRSENNVPCELFCRGIHSSGINISIFYHSSVNVVDWAHYTLDKANSLVINWAFTIPKRKLILEKKKTLLCSDLPKIFLKCNWKHPNPRVAKSENCGKWTLRRNALFCMHVCMSMHPGGCVYWCEDLCYKGIE